MFLLIGSQCTYKTAKLESKCKTICESKLFCFGALELCHKIFHQLFLSSNMMMVRILAFMSAHAYLLVSSSLAYGEGYGFETVSDIGGWLEKKADHQRVFMRGSNRTALDESLNLDESVYGVFDDDELEIEDWEADLESNSTIVDYDDELHRRHLAMMSKRDRQWLNSHNARRRKYHAKFNKKFVPLKWSRKLKLSSKKWAKHLANKCGRQGIYHDPNNLYGENLASNWGTGSYARRPSTDSVLTRLVENEEKFDYPENGHFTQVLWRATAFVGCAEHTKQFRDGSGKKCHVQVSKLLFLIVSLPVSSHLPTMKLF